MVNDTNSDKLDQTVKKALNNYQAPYYAEDWSKMEKMLDEAHTSGNFNWINTRSVFISLAVLGGACIIYYLTTTSNKTETIKESEIIRQPAASSAKEAITKPVSIPSPLKPGTSAEIENHLEKSTSENTVSEISTLKKEAEPAKETARIENNISNTDNKETGKQSEKKKQIINTMGNEPVFGDMLDSTKGIVSKTKEKEVVKKAAKTQPESAIGWNNFLLKNNLDSLKKYHDQQQKDSLKK